MLLVGKLVVQDSCQECKKNQGVRKISIDKGHFRYACFNYSAGKTWPR